MVSSFKTTYATFIPQRLKFMDNVSRSPCLSHMAASVEGIATISSFDQGQRFYLRLGSVLVDTYNLKCSECDMIITIKNIPMWVFL